jgi:chitinase
MVGVPSYGRSFGMTDKSCTGPECTYTGGYDESTAQEGKCTKTAGIIAQAEIDLIISLNDTTNKAFYDQGSDSDIIVWNNTWAAYMSSNTLTSRKDYYKGLNFGGSVDWAIDLNEFTGDDGEPDSDDNEWDEPPVPTLDKCTAKFKCLEDLAGASVPTHCSAQYIVQTLSDLLSDAMKNYTDLMDDGYDAKFKIYSDSIASNAAASVHDFVYQNGSDYFTCMVDEDLICCDQCNASPQSYNCDKCFKGDCYTDCETLGCEQSGQIGKPKLIYKWEQLSEPCPPDYSERFLKDQDHPESVHWTLPSDNADKFYAELYASTGINQSFIEFGTYTRMRNCNGDVDSDDDCWKTGYDFNIPKVHGYDASDVSNPKDTAKKGLDRAGTLQPQIKDALLELSTDSYTGSGADLVDSISVPILMIVSAIQEMGTVEKVADEISAEEKKLKREEIIGGFIAAILFLIPVAGEVLGTVEALADVAVVLSIAGTAADVGLSVADIVKNPNNAALDIMNIVFDAGALASVSKVSKAANIRREMKDADVAKLGTKVSDGLKTLEKIIGKCTA